MDFCIFGSSSLINFEDMRGGGVRISHLMILSENFMPCTNRDKGVIYDNIIIQLHAVLNDFNLDFRKTDMLWPEMSLLRQQIGVRRL